MEIDQLRVEQLVDLPSENPEWLLLGAACGNPFTTWEWASAWWQQFGEDRPQRILGCRDEDGELVGILPLFLASSRPARVLRFIGHGAADQLGPVCRSEHREAVAAAFRRELNERRDWDVCVAERLAVDDGWPDLIGGAEARTERSPTIRLGTADWNEFLSRYSSNFRGQVRNFERRLARNHELAFRLADDPDRLEDDMSTLFDLHEARWAGVADGSTVFSGGLDQFHRRFAAEALASGWLRLSFLELDGTPAAAAYVFRLGGMDWLYQQGWNPDLADKRVGRVLLNNAVREAVRDGMGEFKFLLGSEGYKNRYTNVDAPVRTVALGRTAAVRSAIAAAIPIKRRVDSARASLSRALPAAMPLAEELPVGLTPLGI
jgi:CelD/BcsL family acetyltransferase involved in cellulose biosynthesis